MELGAVKFWHLFCPVTKQVKMNKRLDGCCIYVLIYIY